MSAHRDASRFTDPNTAIDHVRRVARETAAESGYNAAATALLALYREYRDVVGQFKYVVETERRFYLANEVSLEREDTEHDFYFELTMNDVWVWDVYRSDRFVKSVRVLTFKDVNVEVRGDKDLELPKELALDE